MVKTKLLEILESLQRLKTIYYEDVQHVPKELNEYVDKLYKKEKYKKKINIKQIREDAKKFWEDLLLESLNKLKEKIAKRKIKRKEFQKFVNDLNSIKEEIVYGEIALNDYLVTYVKLKNIRGLIKERMDLEKIEHEREMNNKHWNGIQVGIGVIAGWLLSKIF